MNETNLKGLADEIAGKLLAAGFTVHRYDAHGTRSVYLKLDYGAANSIRVGDHPGKRHLKYRYNIGPWIDSPREDRDMGYPRLYWPADMGDALVSACVSARDEKVSERGDGGYARLVEAMKRKSADAPGFWRQARKVSA